MAQNTDKTLMHKLIYSVFVRNHTPEGTFRALEGDLDRLRELGTDIVWLMPIHPIGEEGRKGTLGLLQQVVVDAVHQKTQHRLLHSIPSFSRRCRNRRRLRNREDLIFSSPVPQASAISRMLSPYQ